jgi:ABC-type polysaccharide/polyol phosphate transport system ATPase subunit
MLFDDLVLDVDGLGKVYSRRVENERARLRSAFWRVLFRMTPRAVTPEDQGDFWALKDISFKLRRGDALGIIGLNGSGKTSLLRILAGQVVPDAGQMTLAGKSAAMIDLTAGFNPVQSARDNIYLRGAALGWSRAQIEDRFDDIVEFSELKDAIEAPVASFSSGMVMRLAFSIMVIANPDLLFIDEVLAVGDFRFRQKCLGRLRELRRQSSFVMVSHSMGDIKAFCSEVLVLHKGRMVFKGAPDEAVDVYQSLEFGEPESDRKRIESILTPQFENSDTITDVRHFWCDESGNPIDSVTAGETLFFKLSFRSKIDIRRLVIGVPVWTEKGEYVTGFSTELGAESYSVASDTSVSFCLEVPHVPFNEGVYVSNIGIMDGLEFLYRRANVALHVKACHPLTWGLVTLAHEWRRVD